LLCCEGFQACLVQEDYHVHSDALGFLHLDHLPTICRKLRVKPGQQAEESPEGSDGSNTLALGRDGMYAASQTANLAPGWTSPTLLMAASEMAAENIRGLITLNSIS